MTITLAKYQNMTHIDFEHTTPGGWTVKVEASADVDGSCPNLDPGMLQVNVPLCESDGPFDFNDIDWKNIREKAEIRLIEKAAHETS